VRASRSSGPGGQHANVTASRVEASFDVRASPTLTDVQRERVLARALVAPKRRRATRPTAASRERRLAAKRRAAERKRERRPPGDS
jgi:ribosome-associated protein